MGVATALLITDQDFMAEALKEAHLAAFEDEVPVGAVLVHNGEIIARAHNQTITLNDPSAHAEILALRQAGTVLANYRLLHTTLYVTLEPCIMCFGALVHARIDRLVFATLDPKTGVCGSKMNATSLSISNHRFKIESGVLGQESAALLSHFFQSKRAAQKYSGHQGACSNRRKNNP